jgi:protein CpxP
MKTLKIGIVALVLLFSNFIQAQQPNQNANRTPEERAKMHSKKLTEQLGLTADQEQNIYTYCLQHAQQQEADRAKYKGDREAMKNAHMQNNQNFDANIEKILTADQKTKYAQIKQEEKAKFEQNREQRGQRE